MVKVITYGTYDLLHAGHIRLLERAKALGDYLIVGITADDYDKQRGKINVKQPLIERIEAVKATRLADEIIVEEYEGQKIDDIRRLEVDIFTVGSDWVGYFDYLNEYCKVIYLERTQGVSSSELRSKNRKLRMGLVGESSVINKFESECKYVNGIEIVGICSRSIHNFNDNVKNSYEITDDYSAMLESVDAVYILSHPNLHYIQVREALERGKHVLCESPIALDRKSCNELFNLAKEKECILTEAIKTAYSTAYSRLLLLAQCGKIGNIVSVDAACTSLKNIHSMSEDLRLMEWNSLAAWGPTALLPVFQLLGTDYKSKHIVSHVLEDDSSFDTFTKIDFLYPDAVASIKVGKGIKSEGDLVISGSKGYIYVPAPWWKTDYFELRFENPADNKRYYYQLDGEGIRYEIIAFLKAIENKCNNFYISEKISYGITGILEDFLRGECVIYI